jgi:hypothetical protein
MKQKTTDTTKGRQECAREGCTTAPFFGENFCSVLHRRQHELLYGWDSEPEESDEQEAPASGWREDGRVDIDAVRAGTHDVNDSAAVLESLCDEVEELRAAKGPGRCQTGKAEQLCSPKISTYGTTSASLGDYDSLGDAGAETYLARCRNCNAVFVGIAPMGVYSDEPGFDARVVWVRVEGGASE